MRTKKKLKEHKTKSRTFHNKVNNPNKLSVDDIREILRYARDNSMEAWDKARTQALTSVVPGEYDPDSLAPEGSRVFHFGQDKLVLPEGTMRTKIGMSEEVAIPPPPKSNLGVRLMPITELPEWAQVAFPGYTHLNAVQSAVVPAAFDSGANLLVCAPTGAGKTDIAVLTILREIQQHIDSDGIVDTKSFKIVYIAPMKALAGEIVEKFNVKLNSLGMITRECTGDMQLSKSELMTTNIIVTTPEKWDVITRKNSDMVLVQSVKLLIIDEVHLLHDERGPVLECLVARTLRLVEGTQSMIRIVGLSATLPNPLDVGLFLRASQDTVCVFDAKYRPVPLSQTFIGVYEKNRNPMDVRGSMNEVCWNKVLDSVKRGNQVLVFVHARNDTYRTARYLCDVMNQQGVADLFRPDDEVLRRESKDLSRIRSFELKELIGAGWAVHHAGLVRADRNKVEQLFRSGFVKVLVCTATLAWGVNLPAHTVIMRGTQLYDAKAGGYKDVGMLDILQVFG